MAEFEFEPEPDEWEEQFSKERLKEENELLKEQLGDEGGVFFGSDHVTPEIENQFLRNIRDFEEADRLPKREIRSLFPDGFIFPEAEGMTRRELRAKLNQILLILEDHGIGLDLIGKVPDEVVYNHIIHEALNDEIPLELPEGFRYHIDGCDGYCPECFQRPYCENGKEPWPEDEGDSARK
jgi:hypothetical protein